jgi:hypothetical protein
MSKIHNEMRIWRKHLKNSRTKKCISCLLLHSLKGYLCADCELMESEHS